MAAPPDPQALESAITLGLPLGESRRENSGVCSGNRTRGDLRPGKRFGNDRRSSITWISLNRPDKLIVMGLLAASTREMAWSLYCLLNSIRARRTKARVTNAKKPRYNDDGARRNIFCVHTPAYASHDDQSWGRICIQLTFRESADWVCRKKHPLASAAMKDLRPTWEREIGRAHV